MSGRKIKANTLSRKFAAEPCGLALIRVECRLQMWLTFLFKSFCISRMKGMFALLSVPWDRGAFMK